MQAGPGIEVEQFRLERLLGTGGLGQVWLALDLKLDRRVALKLLRADRAAAAGTLLDEARALARLSHPHIVTVFATGEWNGQTFIALEFLEGATLRSRLSSGLGEGEAIRIAGSLASALAAAHEARLVHGDVKPENVVIPSDGRARLVDFGLARLEGEVVSGGEGTSAYLAPERAQHSVATAASDVWSLGLVLRELITGKRTSGAPLPRGISELVEEACDFDPARRPSAAQFASRCFAALSNRLDAAHASPFRALVPFEESDHALFFGRELEVASFVERLRHAPLVTLIGFSGAGKSSFLRAGVVPRLREMGRWHLVTLRPGSRPFHALADALTSGRAAWAVQPTLAGNDATASKPGVLELLQSSPAALRRELEAISVETGAQVLLVVDQAEEVLTHAPDLAPGFFALLAHAATAEAKVRVAIVLREEFLGAAVRVAGGSLGEIAVLPAIGAQQLLSTLTEPVARLGHRFEDPALPRDMVNEVEGSSAALPLLQFCAARLWEARDVEQRQLLRSAYTRLGGVIGALVQHADSVIDALTTEQRGSARVIFMRAITEFGTRRVCSEAALLDGLPAGAGTVLARLVEGRLLVRRRAQESDEAQIELAHEALLSAWSRLRRWRDEGGERASRLADLRDRAQRWRARGDALLLTGTEANEAARLLNDEPADAVTREFVARSVAVHRRAALARRALVAGAMLVLLAFVAGLTRLWLSATESANVARAAEAHALLETVEEAAARKDPFEARARARRAIELADEPAGAQAWFRLDRAPLRDAVRTEGPVWEVSYSADGRYLAMAVEGTDVLVMDLLERVPRRLSGHSAEVVAVAFSPDARWLLSADHLGEVRRWSWPEGTSVVLGHHASEVYALAFSADGQWAASGALERVVKRYHLASGAQRGSWTLDDAALGLSFAPDGALFATSTSGRLYALSADGDASQWFAVQPQAATVAVSADGASAVVGGNDATARRYALDGGAAATISRAQLGAITEVAMHPTAPWFASASRDGTAWLFALDTGKALRRFAPSEGPSDALYDVDFSRDGARLAAAGGDGYAYVFSLGGLEHDGLDRGSRGPLRFLAAHPDGRRVASTGDDAMVRVWDIATRTLERSFPAGTRPLRTVSFSSDGAWVAAGSTDGQVYVFPLGDGAPVRLPVSNDAVNAVAFSPTAPLLAVGARDGWLRLVDLRETRRVPVSIRAHAGSIESVAWSTDGARLASASLNGEVAWWTAGLVERHREQVGAGLQVVSFAANDTLLVSTDDEVMLFDAKYERRASAAVDGGMLYDAQPVDGDRAVVASNSGAVFELELTRGTSRQLTSGRPAHAVRVVGTSLVWGDEDGTLHQTRWPVESLVTAELAPRLVGWSLEGDVLIEAQSGRRTQLASRPASIPSCVEALPSQTLAVGFENGDVGLWSRDGKLLTLEHVHGPVIALTRDATKLRARSPLGELEIPLGALLDSRCELLRRVWRESPSVWTPDGTRVSRPSSDDPCLTTP